MKPYVINFKHFAECFLVSAAKYCWISQCLFIIWCPHSSELARNCRKPMNQAPENAFERKPRTI